MVQIIPCVPETAALGLVLVLCAVVQAQAQELVTNPGFSDAGGGDVPEGWSVWEPGVPGATCTVRKVEGGVRMEAQRKPFAVGGLSQDLREVQGGQAYAVEVSGVAEDVPAPYYSALVRVMWMQDGRALHPAGVLVRGPNVEGDRIRFEDVLVAPEEANSARVSLDVKWMQGGSITWERASVRPTSPPSPRKVRIGTVYLRPRDSTPERNLELFCAQIDSAGAHGVDIVCLGEAITVVGTGRSYAECAEPIPGPSTERLGRAAREHHLWVVAGLFERVGETVYNTAVLLNREGELAGTYRKVHLPREEWTKGITPGDAYPVFETDFGTIAIQICYDWFFPEPESIFALQGAEIIFAPTWGNTLPDSPDGRVHGETTFRVRARDNGVYMVPSVYGGDSMVIDPMGRILVSSKGQEGMVWTEVDLNVREPLPFVGHWRSIGPRHRLPHTYAPVLERMQKPTY